MSSTLLRAALEASASRPGIDVLGVVDAAPAPPGRLRLPSALAAELGRQVFEPRAAPPGLRRELPLARPARLARRRGVPLLVPHGGAVNDPGFVRGVEGELRPDGALALGVAQVFGPRLLAACGSAANYHDGRLPDYRGIMATAWSVYRGEVRSGFSFHRMTPGVDAGPVLVRDDVPIASGALTGQVLRAKNRLAGVRIGEALDRLAGGDEGQPQEGEGTTYTRADAAAMIAVRDPSTLTWDELQRRVRAFEMLRIDLAGGRWEVTALRRVHGARREGRLAFTTSDAVRAEPSRFVHLPGSLYRAYRPLRARRR